MDNGVSPATEGRHEERVLTLSAITQGPFDPAAVKVACFAELPPAEKRVDHRDFLICRGNGNLGLCGAGRYSPEDMHDTIFPDTMIAARVDDSVLFRAYLESLWGTRFVRDQLERGARTTNGTHKVNQTVIENVELIVPPMELQCRYSAIISLARHMAGQFQDRRYDDLFQALVQRAFRGEL